MTASLGAVIFRVAARLQWADRTRTDLVAIALIIVVGTIVAYLRLPTSTSATLWAEDSRNFLGNAVTQGPIEPLFRVYAGYLHTVPRMIAALTVTFVPISQWAHAMAAASCVVVAVIAATVFFCARVVTESWLLRLALAAITILAPLAPREVLGNTANLHWYFLWLAPWLILYRSPGRRGTIALTMIAVLGSLTEVQMLAFVPLLILRRKTGARLPVRIALLSGGLLQIVAYLNAPRGHSNVAPNSAPSTAYGYLINSAMTIWNADGPTIGKALVEYGPAAAIAAFMPVALAAFWALRFGTRDQRWLVVTFLTASIILWVLAIHTNPRVYDEYSSYAKSHLANPWLSRYGVVPSMDLIAIMMIALGVPWRVPAPSPAPAISRSTPRTARLALSAALFACLLISFIPSSTRRSGGPEFAPQVTAAERACVREPPKTVIVLVSPPDSSWKIHTSCRRLPAAAAKTSTPAVDD